MKWWLPPRGLRAALRVALPPRGATPRRLGSVGGAGSRLRAPMALALAAAVLVWGAWFGGGSGVAPAAAGAGKAPFWV